MLILLSILSLLNGIVIIMLGQYILQQNSKSSLNRVFALLCAFAGAWAFDEFAYRQAASVASASFWIDLNVFMWPFVTPLYLHFALIYTKKASWLKRKITYVILYAPSAAITILGASTNLIYSGPVKTPWGFAPGLPDNRLYLTIATLWVIILALAAIVIVWRYRSMTTDRKTRKQASLIVIGFLFPVLAGSLSEFILPLSGIAVPELTASFLIGLVAFVAYAISRYGLFVLSPEAAAQNIIATMSEALLITSPKGKILNYNKALLDMLGYTEDELRGRSARILWAERQTIRSLTQALPYKGPPLRNFEGKFRKKNRETLNVLFSVSSIRDKRGELAGFVGTAVDITELKLAREARVVADYLQEALLRLPKKIEGIDFDYLYRSASEQARVGGDFFDLFELGNGKVGIVVGDVSGKGIEAAALTSLIKDSIKAYIFLGLPPHSVMGKTNEVVARTTELETFATLFLGILDTGTGELIYCNAGHMAGILKSANRIRFLEANSSLIGFFKGQHYMSSQEQMSKGETLILYTDGITEARHDKEFFGEKRLANLVAEADEIIAKEFPRRIVDEVTRFSRGNLADDIAILTISLEAAPQAKTTAA